MTDDKAAEVASGTRLSCLDAEFREWPHGILDALRSREPVHLDREFDRVVLSRADDVAALLPDRSVSVDPRNSRPGSMVRRLFKVDDPNYRPSLVHLDDPEHRMLRGLVSSAFTSRSVEAMRPQIEATMTGLLDAIDPDAPFELMVAVADPLPVVVIATMLGFDPAGRADFKAWSNALALMFNPVRTAADEERLAWGDGELRRSLKAAIAQRRSQPTNDLIGRLVGAEMSGQRLDEQDIIETCVILLIAGNLTTTDLIGNVVHALLRHPAALTAVRAQPELVGAAIEETLRWDTPVQTVGRIALAPGEMRGCPIAAGQSITLSLTAANHDPALNEDPHSFQLGRADRQHFSFGGGAHFCLGASLARLEGQIAVSMLLERFPRLRLSEQQPVRRALPAFSGFTSLWLKP